MSGCERAQRRQRLVLGGRSDDQFSAGEVGGRERARERVGVAIDRDDDGDEVIRILGYAKFRGYEEFSSSNLSPQILSSTNPQLLKSSAPQILDD